MNNSKTDEINQVNEEDKPKTNEDSIKKVYKKFKEYYKDDNFRSKHLRYVNQKVPCECGQQVSRGNISKHKRTDKHKKRMTTQDQENIEERVLKAVKETLQFLQHKQQN